MNVKSRKKEKKIQVVKIPLDYIPEDIQSNFQSMPQLYLELLENKKKVIQELKDKPYIPKISSQTSKKGEILDFTNIDSSEELKEKEINRYKKEMDEQEQEEKLKDKALREERDKERERDKVRDKEHETGRDRERERAREQEKDKDREKDKERDKDGEHERGRDKEHERGRDRERERDRERDKERGRERDKDREHDKERDKDRERERDKDRERDRERDKDRDRERDRYKNASRHPERYRAEQERNSRKDSKRESRSDRHSKKEQSEASKRLNELLRNDNGNDNEKTNKESTKTPPGHVRLPPNLSEIEKGQKGNTFTLNNGTQVKDVSTGGEDEAAKKRELLFRFSILKKTYPLTNVQEYTEYSDLNTMQKTYDDTVRHIHLDSTVENYKKYLVWGFMGVEYVLGNWFKFDMTGFTQQQVLSMNSYERLLIELGEKTYIGGQSNWPVEVRLLAVIVMNAAFFIVSKMIMNKTGTNIMNMMNSMTSKPVAAPSQPVAQTANNASNVTQKKKMQGPNISLSDLDSELPTNQQQKQPQQFPNVRTQTTQPIIPKVVGGDHSMPNLNIPKK